ncbi:2-amino-4-hydroxy-6-hydroxymethyldihydropteridine diphosphokinase [Larkinella terrae]|uniref:2-amino-4-hydroxy-6-hydroxymethyldihydropteridine pyrophosphokinase n=1 Tax=Larkinella terrae TaxID=2025311 RepID=A0A7K0EGJ3_9BACT|nr:2-amino-4-hydroxy-6-hydroxymethyldihydropteridine diphosphokinase [Larkinella terrae]MRS60969.1 2-amino-4-hydroxy-6-hydroxymethyldihydropteridine diphosphokinase [Larkinella terrae]
MHTVYLLLGANLGDREATLQRALEAIQVDLGPVLQQSALYETAAWGVTDQPAFLNQVLKVLSVFPAEEMLEKTQAIENRLGRVRREKWGSRVIDIDLLYVDETVLNSETLTVPHPFLHERRFTLVPLAEIAPEFVHPVFHKTNRQLLAECPDLGAVRKLAP